jgi:hypothetical protein
MWKQVPHKVQHIMSNKHTPILSGAILSFEIFMSRWEKLVADHTHLATLVMPGLDKAYEYYSRMDRTRAYIIAMCMYTQIVSCRKLMICLQC